MRVMVFGKATEDGEMRRAPTPEATRGVRGDGPVHRGAGQGRRIRGGYGALNCPRKVCARGKDSWTLRKVGGYVKKKSVRNCLALQAALTGVTSRHASRSEADIWAGLQYVCFVCQREK